MIYSRHFISLILVCALGLEGCGGGTPPLETGLSVLDPDQVGPILLGANLQEQWTRPIHPESNETFTTIDGNPYYRIGPDDELQLSINLEDGPTEFELVISPDGYITLPATLLQERVYITGLAVPQAEQRLVASLTPVLQRPFLLLRVTTYRHSQVTLIGEVAQRGVGANTGEGRYPLKGRTTLLDFVLFHSLLTDETDLTVVIVTDAEGHSQMFDLEATMYSADQSQNPILDRGDVVTVPSLADTRRYIYVLGEVMNPSLLRPRPGMTVLDAIAEAGGPNERARQKWVSLVRGRGHNAVLYKIPYSNMLKSGDMSMNASLVSGDILVVGRSTYNTATEFFRDMWSVLQSAVVASILYRDFIR